MPVLSKKYFHASSPSVFGPYIIGIQSDQYEFLYRRNIYKRQFLDICILKARDQRLCGVDRCQHINSCLNGIPADDESVFRVLCPLSRNIDDKIDLMSQDQVKEIR